MYAKTPTAGVPFGVGVAVTVGVAVGVTQLQQGPKPDIDDSQ
jgi:hypothetical protein